MLAEHTAPDEAPGGSPLQLLVMHILRVVTDVMVEDVGLAEQLRVAALRIWMAERRTAQPHHAQVAWWDIQDNEDQLRALLGAVRRRCCVDTERFNQALLLLNKATHHRLTHMAVEHAA